jgi:hypothetical protein
MPSYVVRSESPITVRAVERPDLPGWAPEHPWVPGDGGGDERPDTGGPGGWPGLPERPGRPIYPVLPSRDDLIDMLPPGLKPGVGLPIPPTPDHPWVPVEPDPEHPEVWPPPGVVWPPLRPERPGMPDLSGKTLMAGAFYVSGLHRPPVWGYIVIDHDAAKGFVQRVKEWITARLPAGGAAGRPPARPQPGG